MHEPQVYCLAKGKAHKPYEFGSKASVVMTATHVVIIAAVAHAQNEYDGHTLPEVLEWAEASKRHAEHGLTRMTKATETS